VDAESLEERGTHGCIIENMSCGDTVSLFRGSSDSTSCSRAGGSGPQMSSWSWCELVKGVASLKIMPNLVYA
jgi:hypothetical protein